VVARAIASCGYPTINRLSASQHIRCRERDVAAGGTERYLAWPVENKLAIAQLVEHLTVDIADIRWSLVRFRVARLCTLVANVLQHVQVSERYENPAKERACDTEGIRTLAGRAQWISSPSP
jgi:hypothetical protein